MMREIEKSAERIIEVIMLWLEASAKREGRSPAEFR